MKKLHKDNINIPRLTTKVNEIIDYIDYIEALIQGKVEPEEKDNPVPSLTDNQIKKALKEKGYSYKDTPLGLMNVKIVRDVLDYWKNGVETDNEQPKCTVCGTPTTRKKTNRDIYVCIDCSH